MAACHDHDVGCATKVQCGWLCQYFGGKVPTKRQHFSPCIAAFRLPPSALRSLVRCSTIIITQPLMTLVFVTLLALNATAVFDYSLQFISALEKFPQTTTLHQDGRAIPPHEW